MKRIFITYGDEHFTAAKERLIKLATYTHEFDKIYSYGREDLSSELMSSKVINIKRGGGLWSWKPDIILSTMNQHENGDIIVYCDAGCSVYPSYEWKKYWKILENHDIIAQRIYQRTDHWTRKELLEAFNINGVKWHKCYQYQATIIIIISDFTRKFIREWRDIMIEQPKLVSDVEEKEIEIQKSCFIENRHDQALYSSLIYKYLKNPKTKNRIYTQWEHIEDYDPFFKQAIRATRLRNGEEETYKRKIILCFKRLIKDYIYKPFYYAPLQWLYSL